MLFRSRVLNPESRVQNPETENGRRTIRYEMVDYADRRSGLTAMMRTTGFSAAIVALMLGRGQIECAGAFAGENCIPSAEYISELRRRGLRLRVTES